LGQLIFILTVGCFYFKETRLAFWFLVFFFKSVAKMEGKASANTKRVCPPADCIILFFDVGNGRKKEIHVLV